jgi:hypothetical protein
MRREILAATMHSRKILHKKYSIPAVRTPVFGCKTTVSHEGDFELRVTEMVSFLLP